MTELIQYRIRGASAAELVRDIESAVAGGKLAAGERLPSIRALAGELELSPATVAAGLAELRRRGVLVSEQRRGTRISERPPIELARARLPVPSGARDLSLGNPDPALLPDLGRALARARVPVRLYGEPPALGELLEFARAQLRMDGLPGDSLCIVSGALDGIERVLQAHTRPGDRIAVENPGYAAMFDLLRSLGLLLEPVTVDDRGMLPGELDRALGAGASAVIITPRAQNPTGASLDRERARELRGVIAAHPQALLIEDDHLGQIAGSDLHSTITERARWAATRSVSKAMGPDLRLAVLTGDAYTIARVQGRQQCGPGWVSHILQALVFTLWSDPLVQEQMDTARAAYSERRLRFLARLRAEGVPGSGASGLNVWVAVADEAGALAALLQRGWVVAAGTPYRLAGADPAIRITTATLSEREGERLSGDLADVLAPGSASRSG
jgi:DNA-binding transcriptional MocR family regulator